MSFALTGKESIVVYGAGTQGKKFVEIFHKNGFQIKAILDKNAETMNSVIVNHLAIQVIIPEKYVVQSQDEIVIISLWNALWHEKIVDVLQKIGFKKIIFIPISMSGNRKLMSVMRNVFNEILDGNVFLDDIPEYAEMTDNVNQNLLVDNHIYMPIELLFSEENFVVPTEELTGSELMKRKNVMKTAGENIANLKPYYQLFRYLDKSEGKCDEYLRTQIIDVEDNEKKKKILKDRYDLFQIYEKAFEANRDFFWDSAPRIIWNERGYFNIIDGHHRIAYLFYKGIWDVPVRVRKEDMKYLKMIENIPNSFLSESFYLMKADNSLFWRKKNVIICSSLMKKDVLNKSIYINLNDAGYIARYCCRMGCKLCVDIETEETMDFALQVSDIFQYGNRMTINRNRELAGNVDIAIIDEDYFMNEEDVYALTYILKFEKNGIWHNEIVKKNINYNLLGSVFNGKKEYFVIQITRSNI